MPPKRNRPLTEAYEQEFEQRIMERMEERLGQFVDQLTDEMNDLMNNRKRRNLRREDEDEESEENPASAWWQHMKLTRERVRKSKITSWQKMKKCMRANFIPHNYQRLMYKRLQNLKQGSKSVEDYTTEFYQLIARNDIQKREDQLVSRYIRGLRVQIMDSVNMFDPMTLSDAFQRALAFEKQNRRVGSSSSPAITGVSGSGNAVSRFAPTQAKAGGGNTGPVPKATGSSRLKCFNCGEPGHRQSEYVFNVKHLLPYHGNSSNEDSVGNSRTNFVYPGGNDVNPSIKERADLFLEAQDRDARIDDSLQSIIVPIDGTKTKPGLLIDNYACLLDTWEVDNFKFITLYIDSSKSAMDDNGGSMQLAFVGSLVTPSVSLSDVYYIQSLTRNLASDGQIYDFGYDVRLFIF
nr:reverse transcriptase domain-containing protein [Tanacetum cinerariifolium]